MFKLYVWPVFVDSGSAFFTTKSAKDAKLGWFLILDFKFWILMLSFYWFLARYAQAAKKDSVS